MNIAVWHHLPSGGGKRALYDQVRGLVQRGHRVEAWSPSTANHQFSPLTDLVTEHVLPVSDVDASRPMKWLLDGAHAHSYQIGHVLKMAEHARRFAGEINRGDWDVVFAAPCQWFHAPAVARHVTVPTVLYLQEPARHLYEATHGLPWLAEPDIEPDSCAPRNLKRILGSALRIHASRIQAREELLNARAFDRILVNSRFSRESTARAYGLDSRLCYLGIDTTRFSESAQPREPFVLSVGQFSPHKNPEFIIRALALTESKPPLVWIANVATRGYPEEMQRLASQLNVDMRIELMASDDALIRYYQRGAALVYAPRLEPFGFAPLEANSCGMPVVAVAEGGIRETVEHQRNGLLVDSPQQMAAAVDALMRDPSLAERLGRNGARLVREHWTVEQGVDRLERQLHDVRASSP